MFPQLIRKWTADSVARSSEDTPHLDRSISESIKVSGRRRLHNSNRRMNAK